MIDDAALLSQFLENTIDLEAFDHKAHVRVTFLLLHDRPLPETMIALRDGLKRIAARAGHPEKYHETMTFAFAAVISSRIRASVTWEEFARENADLFAWRRLLDRIYDRSTLASDLARRSFVLPRSEPEPELEPEPGQISSPEPGSNAMDRPLERQHPAPI